MANTLKNRSPSLLDTWSSGKERRKKRNLCSETPRALFYFIGIDFAIVGGGNNAHRFPYCGLHFGILHRVGSIFSWNYKNKLRTNEFTASRTFSW